MANKDGSKSGGRAKGVPNKKTLSLIERCEEYGYDSFEEMIRAAQEESEPKERFRMAAEIAQYIYPKRKAIEHSMDQDKGFRVIIEDYSKKGKPDSNGS
jgi:hypothetical protein